MSPDIEVFVRWKEQTIFAGEDVECTITFRNVAPDDQINEPVNTPRHYRGGSRPMNGVTEGTNYSPAKSLNPFSLGNSNRRPQSAGYRSRQPSHRPAASLSSPPTFSQSFPPPTPPTTHDKNNRRNNANSSGHGHQRSVSIISLETDLNNDRKPAPTRPGNGHSRSSSFQVASRRNDSYTDLMPNLPSRSPIQRLPQSESQSSLPSPTPQDNSGTPRLSAPSSPVIRNSLRRSPARRPMPLQPDFKFPQAPPSSTPESESALRPLTTTLSTESSGGRTISNLQASPASDRSTRLPPATKLSALSTVGGSTRSSAEFFSVSNNSTETLESEYRSPLVPIHRSPLPLRHRRHFSSIETPSKNQFHDPQTLLMGYAQINASFTVDGSLIDQSVFEEVKRKGVMGNDAQSERPSSARPGKPRGGFWGNLGLNNFGDSLTGLLSSGELNGLRDMRGVSSSRSIPLLSTPQSLLFVDLRLSPGEEKSFSFTFTLPRGLPASHKGKVIKIAYNLVIGTQRAANPKELQRVHRINVPFRVLSGVDAQGGVLGHDLMRPYVLLRDEARIRKLDSDTLLKPREKKSISVKAWNSAPQFLAYVDEILGQKARRESLNPLTPVDSSTSNPEMAGGTMTCKDAIEFAILRSNRSDTSERSPNRFEITRSGRRVAVIILNRPSHRLGETVVVAIDFSGASLPTYSLHGSLETCEKVSPTLALRSSASITRATRKTHATYYENSLFASRVVFTPSIPVSATPTLVTSVVNLEWQLRFEFVTSRLEDAEDHLGATGVSLLEPVESDDRGTIHTASESLGCESFEISIPLTVYGCSVQEPGRDELQGIPI